MTITTAMFSRVTMAMVLAVGVPASVAAQRHQAPHGEGGRESSGRGGGQAVPRGDSGGGTASAPRPVGGEGSVAATAPRRSESEGDQDRGRARPSSRQRGGQAPTDRAVARRSVPPSGGRPIIIERGYYSGYYPWGYGGYGFGGYYGGYYDPWYYGGGYGYPAYYSTGYEGSLRIKVKPRDGSVFVDGYFVGQVDEFDGVFQRLRVEPGPHRVEIRADGYEPLSFEVRIQPGRSINYSGELRRLP